MVSVLFVGLGWFVTDNVVIEYVGRSTTTELKVHSNSTSDHLDVKGVLASAVLNLKYFFN